MLPHPVRQGGRSRRAAQWSLCVIGWAGALCADPSAGGFNDRVFYLNQEFYGPAAYTDPAAASNLRNAMANSVAFSPPVDSGMARFVTDRDAALILDLPGAAGPAGAPPAYIDLQAAALASLAGSLGRDRVLWNLLNEWDQSGGSWVPAGRPRYTGLTRTGAAAKFLGYYTAQAPLGAYLAQPRDLRPFLFAAVTDYSPNVFYAFDLGVDTVMLERSIDELADISTGIAFLRGAARQYDRRWGIDISTWRTSNNLATTYNAQGVLLGGWSAGYLKRHYYIAYLSGAHILRTEATAYYDREGRLNPFGRMARDFAEFALRRHPDVGRPYVPMALLIDHDSGFDPKHWIYNQQNAVWYGDIRYGDGDHMIDNFLRLAFPNHWLHGLTPGAPFADAAGKPDPAGFRAYLAAGGDPRPYEPMPCTRWGDNLDVITSRASAEALRNYRVIVILGSVTLSAQLVGDLQEWVRGGGTLVINTSQAAGMDESFLGVGIRPGVRNATASRWLPSGAQYAEPAFSYTTVVPSTAELLAAANGSDPLIALNRVGEGRVILTTPSFLQNTARDQILFIGARLLDWLQEQYALAQVSGPPVEYIVNQAAYGVVVTLLNHSGRDWTGSITADRLRQVSAVKEYIADVDVPFEASGTTTRIPAKVPAYEVRVYGIELWNTGLRRPAR